jgi:hypothetical protein
MNTLEQTSASYAAEAAAIWQQIETEYTTNQNEEVLAQLEAQWRYTRQMAEDFYAAETASLDAIRLA